jgi:hypothetical protein
MLALDRDGRARGAKVRLVCRACRLKQTLTPRSAKLTLRKLLDRRLRRGTVFTVRITAPGAIGQVISRRVKDYGRRRADILRAARDPFVRKRRCIPVGSTKPVRTCSATPPAGP